MQAAMHAADWPALREELTLLPGPRLADGQPSHTLHDPVRHRFFQIDWPTFEILARWSLGQPQAIAAAVSAETTLAVDAAQVQAVFHFLAQHELLRPAANTAAAWGARQRQQRGAWWQWLMHHYLFFRVPLWRPDAWLGRWAGRLDALYSPTFAWLTLAALLVGLFEISRQWERFSATLVDTISWRGLAAYGLTLVVVKLLHELGHAFTAKRLGCKVPTMGVAFLVMWPVAYTDTNDVWRLRRRDQRLQVAAAGIATELVIAAWASLAWALLPPGTLQSMAFVLATSTWVTTVLINASPFMRFDGYFLLADWLAMPNLHARAFALARWDLRERLFALGEVVPEVFPPARRRALIAFAYATWLYRLVVFLGIAVLVYAFFIKALGLLMFAVEIVWFLAWPVARELQAWRQRWPVIRRRPRAACSAAIVLAVLVAALLPWPGRVAATALWRPAEQLVVYAPAQARVQQLPVADGQRVRAGEPLLRLAAPDQLQRRDSAERRLAQSRWEAGQGALDDSRRMQWQVAQQGVASARADLDNIQADDARYRPTAAFDGVVHWMDPDLRAGTWLADREPVLRLVSAQAARVVTYLEGDEVARLRPGDAARFQIDGLEAPVVPLVVDSIDAQAQLTLAEPELATAHGGSLLVRERRGLLYPERALYRVVLVPAAEAPAALLDHQWRGTVTIRVAPQAPWLQPLRQALALLRREAGF